MSSQYGAVSTTIWTTPDGKMADLIAWGKSYDISLSKGCLRMITSQVDASTVICVSLYDTVENMNARKDSSARVSTTPTDKRCCCCGGGKEIFPPNANPPLCLPDKASRCPPPGRASRP